MRRNIMELFQNTKQIDMDEYIYSLVHPSSIYSVLKQPCHKIRSFYKVDKAWITTYNEFGI
jgi:hypothetical protein